MMLLVLNNQALKGIFLSLGNKKSHTGQGQMNREGKGAQPFPAAGSLVQ